MYTAEPAKSVPVPCRADTGGGNDIDLGSVHARGNISDITITYGMLRTAIQHASCTFIRVTRASAASCPCMSFIDMRPHSSIRFRKHCCNISVREKRQASRFVDAIIAAVLVRPRLVIREGARRRTGGRHYEYQRKQVTTRASFDDAQYPSVER